MNTTISDNIRDNLIARMIDTPDSLTHEDIETILSDAELREIYDAAVLCKEASAMNSAVVPDADAELEHFKASRKRHDSRILHYRPLLRIAAIFAGVLVATLAITAALNPDILRIFSPEADETRQDNTATVYTMTLPSEGISPEGNCRITNETELLYDNITLDSISAELSRIYRINTIFDNDSAKSIRLYLRIGQGNTIEDVAGMLNSFDYFKASVENNTLIIR